MSTDLRYLLLQMRNGNDPMRAHEVECFARVLGVPAGRIEVFDLLQRVIADGDLAGSDVVLLGGSGDYSAARGGEWLDGATESLRRIHDSGTPTFCSCWGFQAMARAMGGRVIHDADRAEIGTFQLSLTDAGLADPVFGPLGPTFLAQMGHEDRVCELPPRTTLLASSELVTNQAYRFDDAPIYCTQFHPELTAADLLLRFRNYPHYLEVVAKTTAERLAEQVQETVESEGLLRRFVSATLGGASA